MHSFGSRPRYVILPLWTALVWPFLKYCVQLQVPSTGKIQTCWKKSIAEPWKWLRNWSTSPVSERTERAETVQPEVGKAQVISMCTKKRCKDNGAMPFLVVLSTRTRDVGYRQENKRLCLNIMKHLIVKVMEHWNRLSGETLQSLFFRIFKRCMNTGTEPSAPGASLMHYNQQLNLVLQL